MTVLEEAHQIIYGDREQAYDRPSQNFERIATLWTAYLKIKHKIDFEVDTADVAMLMVLLKMAREVHKHKRDNVVDAIGYLACMQRCVDDDDLQ